MWRLEFNGILMATAGPGKQPHIWIRITLRMPACGNGTGSIPNLPSQFPRALMRVLGLDSGSTILYLPDNISLTFRPLLSGSRPAQLPLQVSRFRERSVGP
jgi:hypothetical protein